MTLAWPALLLAILLIPAGVWLALRIDRRRRGRVTDLSGTMTAAPGPGRRILHRVPSALAVAGLTILALALTRPTAAVALPRLEGTLMLVFDVSASMSAADVAPSRMEAAKAAAAALVDRRPDGVVIGVVAFSDAGVAVQPPTSDMTAVQAAIARLGPTRGTSLGAGILATLDAIDKARATTPREYYSSQTPAPSAAAPAAKPGSDASTLIVVISDGENNERPDPASAAQAVADRGIRITALGVGTAAGATLDLGGFKVDTRLDEATLRQLADITAGSYASAAAGDPAGAVYDELARALVVRQEPLELTAALGALGLLLLIASAGISLARSGRLP